MLDISMLVPGLPIAPDSLETGSLGGSETAGVQMARTLARRGHTVKLFCNTTRPGRAEDGVMYMPLDHWQMYQRTTQHDVAIVQRAPQAFGLPGTAGLNILWCHDMALGRMRDQFMSNMWNIDQVLVLSEYMSKNYTDVYNFPERFKTVTRNGLDLTVPREPLPLSMRKRKQLVYAARPERGLDFLLGSVMPLVLREEPEATLIIVGYDNPVDAHRELYGRCAALGSSLGGAVRMGGNLRKQELYRLYSESAAYVYPTPSPAIPEFREVSCISAMEAQACGLPIVSTWCGALPETVDALAGILVRTAPSVDAELSAREHSEAIVKFLRDDRRWNTAHMAGLARAEHLGWDGVAEQWEQMIDRLFAERNDSPIRLARHLLRRSDVISARRVLEDIPASDESTELLDGIQKDYGFIRSSDAFREHYRQAGEETIRQLRSRPMDAYSPLVSDEPRFIDIEAKLREVNPRSVLDYGCGHGWFIAYMAPRFPETEFHCIDVDPGAIEWSKELLAHHCPSVLSRVHFHVGDHTSMHNVPIVDAAVCSEVLEHCVEPFEVLRTIELKVRPNGAVIVTTPYGPSEYGTPNWDRFRGHLWEFGLHDVREVLGGKPMLTASATRIYDNPVTNEPIGYLLICYAADHAAYRALDWDRRLRRVNPRRTVSVNIMAGGPNATETLDWCMRSVKWIADEIVVADTGLTTKQREMFDVYRVRWVQAPDPRAAGFETPRNMALEASRCDMVLWIDTDEHLLNGQELLRFTRVSMWDAFAVQQHHFMVDGAFPPDLPARLFRRDGKIRFYGMIHEHPESVLNEGPGRVLITSPLVHIAHVGYLTDGIRRQRFDRNYPLLQADEVRYPNRKLQKFFRMRDNHLLNMYELRANGSVVTEAMRQRARQSVSLFREHFLGERCAYAHLNPLEYYTPAMDILGEGAVYTYSVAANRDGVGDTPGNTGQVFVARFKDHVEASEHIAATVKRHGERLSSSVW